MKSGAEIEFEAHMDLCMKRADWNGFESRRDSARQQGKLLGIGMATYVEACAFAGSEPAFLTLNEDGSVLLRIGTQSNGQGHATAYAQLAAAELGVDYTDVDPGKWRWHGWFQISTSWWHLNCAGCQITISEY